ncbi:hypothetical protein VFPPC_15279 [Pochonia chlamydosporia 170]|uniref:Uncharacterized protein n=1 Tax=Pochonia chlamydosporia 170 TaxID=1380566 RepID=A0A179G788_METCM|nr:hypothetical protein VFPPC_15279 [Pochonia chlamydosporia 170]OAQ73273.1 hypothetical protein VFPPC_15279 [Pochonia chlamydosporia 170]
MVLIRGRVCDVSWNNEVLRSTTITRACFARKKNRNGLLVMAARFPGGSKSTHPSIRGSKWSTRTMLCNFPINPPGGKEPACRLTPTLQDAGNSSTSVPIGVTN